MGLAAILLILLFPEQATGTTSTEEDFYTQRLGGVVVAAAIPPTTEIGSINPIPSNSHFNGSQSDDKPSKVVYCLDALKNAGRLPNVPVTTDGYARTVPVKPLEKLRPGMLRVICTNEGIYGHCLEIWVNEDLQMISTVEANHPEGVGRIVDPSVVRGEAIAAIPQ